MNLKQFLTRFHLQMPHDVTAEVLETIQILGMATDSRQVKKNDVFLAFAGQQQHGLQYWNVLIDKKASVVLYETPIDPMPLLNEQTPFLIQVDNLEAFKHTLLKEFYQQSLAKLALIGVTGTEGKTSVTQFCAQALEYLQVPCGVVGTNGIGRLANLQNNTHTTPDQVTLYNVLDQLAQTLPLAPARMQKKPIALEVTSHALDQHRIAGLSFHVRVLTNLARDHLDYHQTIEAYKAAKARLFCEYPATMSVLNADDEFGREMIAALEKQNQPYLTYGALIEKSPPDLYISEMQATQTGIHFCLEYQQQKYQLVTTLFGQFNAWNLAASAGVLLSLGFSFTESCEALSQVARVTGRMQTLHKKGQPTVIVDYAHKPNALAQVLKSARAHTQGQLICVFGCGGNRDKGKRPLMGAIAEELADQVIVTSDNPRHEEMEAIIADIMVGIREASKVKQIADRQLAIETALSHAQADDVVVIAGKGHETYQIIGQQTIHFDDVEIVENYWEKLPCG